MATFTARLHADGPAPSSLPARVFSLYNGLIYIEEIGYLDPSGFRPDISITPFFRSLNPAFVKNGTPDEIVAVAGKTLITQADWRSFLKEGGARGDAAKPARLRASSETYTIAGVTYVAVE